MRLGQIRFDHKISAAVFEGNQARPVPGYTLTELIRKADTESITLAELADQMASRHGVEAQPLIPVGPAEVWASGCTYKPSGEHPRPELFFKGTARVCVGPGQPIGIRFDSKLTAAEPELAVVLGRRGKAVGYTLGNDVSAWDLERENPRFLPQSKTYTGSCALGPVMVTVDELPDISGLQMTCTILREGKVRFRGGVSLAALAPVVPSMIEYLLRANPVPAGSVLLTGTGIALGDDAALAAGDIVTISVPEIGELSNPAVIVR